MSTSVSVFLVMILQADPSLVVEVGYKFSDMNECQAAKHYILQQEKEKPPMLDCWKIDSPNLLSKEEKAKKEAVPKATSKGLRT